MAHKNFYQQLTNENTFLGPEKCDELLTHSLTVAMYSIIRPIYLNQKQQHHLW